MRNLHHDLQEKGVDSFFGGVDTRRLIIMSSALHRAQAYTLMAV